MTPDVPRGTFATPMALLAAGAREMGLTLTSRQQAQLETYLALLLQWNARINLTALKRPEEIVIRHFLDSLQGIPFLPEPPGRMADIGSGAGFPGIPLKICYPRHALDLVESREKKAAFLQVVAARLGLARVRLWRERLERLAVRPEARGAFDLICLRGVALEGLLTAGLPLLRPGGAVLYWTSPRAWEEVRGRLPGWSTETAKSYRLPGQQQDRLLIQLRPAG